MADQADKLRFIVSNKKSALKNDQKIHVIVESGIFAGHYESRIRSVNENDIVITMPTVDNNIVPLEVSDEVLIKNENGQVFKFKIINRKFKPIPVLFLSNVMTKNEKNIKVIAVTSGKGGVGKTNFTVNLAIVLSLLGNRIIVIDADLGLANVDVVLGINPKHNLLSLIRGYKNIEQILFDGPAGIKIIAAGSGIEELINLDEWQIKKVIMELNRLKEFSDIILIDTGAGISKKVLSFISSADDVIVITTPEPTSITDAYALIKVMSSKNHNTKFKLVVNRAMNYKESKVTAEKMSKVCKKFLDIDIEILGYILEDVGISKSVKEQRPFVLKYPHNHTTESFYMIAKKLLEKGSVNKSKKGFWEKFINIFN